MPVERHVRCGDQDETIAWLQAQLAAARAETAVLRGQVSDLTRMVMAEAEPAVQQAILEAQGGRHRRPPEARWLRAVPAVVLMALRPARHKILAGLAAASVAVVVAAPGMDLAPWIAGTTPPAAAHARGAPSAAARVLPTPPGKGKGRGGVASPPPGRPSSPPGRGKPGPSPAATPAATGTATGTATDTPSPDTPSPAATGTPDTDTPSPGPAATGTPGPDPTATATAAACPPPGKHKG